jgi:pimeloyl-ACP methyl ester carboxylesterase
MVRRLLIVLVAVTALAVLLLARWLHETHDWPALLALVAAGAVPVVVDATILGQQFVIATWLRRRTRPDLRFGMVAALRAWGGEIVASLRTFFYGQIRHAKRPLPSGDDPARMPVLLVHGYFCNHGIWYPFARWLAARGHAVDAVDLEPVFGPLDGGAAIVAAGVERLRARTGAARVAVVAHSMGGLAVRTFLAAHGHDAVAAVVTLGTPHRGTWLARFGRAANVVQMRPDCDWLCALAARESAAARALFTVVISHHDNIVVPAAIQTLDGARTIEVVGRGHVELAYDRAVWAHAAAAIDAAQRD